MRFHAFQSTPSGGKATALDRQIAPITVVSIHAFRGEGDRRGRGVSQHAIGFNPRLPGGRRHDESRGWQQIVEFQSTPSGGKATRRGARGRRTARRFNPRLPGGRRRAQIAASRWRSSRFNPRLPGGRRQAARLVMVMVVLFQSTPSGGKATGFWCVLGAVWRVSIHAFRGEGDAAARDLPSARAVSIHAFRGEGDRNI